MLESSDGKRHKLVQAAFLHTRKRAQLLHPLGVWTAVRYGSKSEAELAAELPPHMHCELKAICNAIQRRFCGVQRALARTAAQARRSQSDVHLRELLSGMQGFLEDREARVEELETLLAGLSLPKACNEGNHLSRGDIEFLESRGEYQLALQYVLEHSGNIKGTMFLQHSACWSPFPLVRGLVLDCIRPGIDGTVPGYSPPHSFAQTHAKVWALSRPVDSNMALMARAHQGWGDGAAGEVMVGVMRLLPCKDLVKVQLVRITTCFVGQLPAFPYSYISYHTF